MAEEEKNKVTSLSPPPTDEIDDEWGSSSGASKPKHEKPAEKAADKATKAKPAASHRDDDDGDDDDDDDDDDDRDDDEDDDDRDDDDDEDDDDDDDPKASSRRAERPSAGGAPQDWLPDWSPWAVLGGLLTIGFLGGIGIIPVNFNLKQGAEETTAAAATPTTTTTTTTTAPKPTASAKRPTMGERSDTEERVAASHLLVQYKGSARAAPTVTRTKEEAKKRAEEALAKAKKGTPFEKLVGEYSDEMGAAARGGKLGKFPRQAMVPAFADAAFKLKPGQISDVVETQFGFHVILRTE